MAVVVVSPLLSSTEESILFCLREVLEDDVRICECDTVLACNDW